MDDERTIPEMIENRVKRYGGKLFFQHKVGWSWKQITWLDFDKTTKDIACFLIALGFSPGSTALVVSGIRTESIYAELAITLLGGVAISIDEKEDIEKIIRIARDSKSRFIFVGSELILIKIRTQADEIHPLLKIITFTDMSIGEDDWVIPFKGVVKFGSMKRKALEDEMLRKVKDVSPSSTAAVFYSSKSDLDIGRKEITHEDLIEVLRDSSQKLSFINEEDQAFSHLPSVSPYEKLINYVGIYMGSRISIAETRENFFDDVVEIKPTVLFETLGGIEDLCSKALSRAGKGSASKELRSALGGRIKHILIDYIPRREIINLISSAGVSLTDVPMLAGF